MVLTKKEILEDIKNNRLSFKPPLDGFQIQPHAVDLRLGQKFRIPISWSLTQHGREALNVDPLENYSDNFEEISLKPGQYFDLLPKEFVIAETLEEIQLDRSDVMGVLYPRSSINRRGLAVDLSGIIDVGYKGKLVIPLVNNTNDQIIKIYPGERICQILFQKLQSPLKKEEQLQHGLSTAKYHKQASTNSRKDKDAETKLIKSGDFKKLKSDYTID